MKFTVPEFGDDQVLDGCRVRISRVTGGERRFCVTVYHKEPGFRRGNGRLIFAFHVDKAEAVKGAESIFLVCAYDTLRGALQDAVEGRKRRRPRRRKGH